MDSVDPTFDAEAQRGNGPEVQRSGTCFFSLELDFALIHALQTILGTRQASYGLCTFPRPRRRTRR